MAVDLTGGLPPDREAFLPDRPDIADLRDSASFWLFDDRGVLGFPRICVDAGHPAWDTPDVEVNVAFADGRVFRLWRACPRRPQDAAGAAGARPSTLGAGPLEFRCVEPFRLWTSTFRGKAVETSTEALMAGASDGREVDLEFHIEARMAAPPWIMGAMSAQAAQKLSSGAEGAFMGGARYEQMFRAAGVVRVDGAAHEFAGQGMRVRRLGVRNMQGYPGHCMANAIFPSGRAFGYISLGDVDAPGAYDEAFVFTGDGALRPARVVKAPWMTKLRARGDDVSVVLESELGTLQIEGETYATTFDLNTSEMADFMVLHQGGARYVWDGEVTYGAIERATPRAKMRI